MLSSRASCDNHGIICLIIKDKRYFSLSLFYPHLDFDLYVEAEDGGTVANISSKKVLMRLWKPSRQNEIKPPSTAFSFIPDKEKKDDESGHYYFR